MKNKYETPSIQIEKFDLKDPDIVASLTSGNTDVVVPVPGPGGKSVLYWGEVDY